MLEIDVIRQRSRPRKTFCNCIKEDVESLGALSWNLGITGEVKSRGELANSMGSPGKWPLKRCVCGRPGELEKLVEGVRQQLRDLAITSNQEPGKIFLGLDMTRAGYVSKENLRDVCIRHNLPCADDIIDCVCSAPDGDSLIVAQ